MELDLTNIIVAVIGLVSAVVTCFIIPKIKASTTKDQWEAVMLYARAAVSAAEVIFDGRGQGKQKLDWVTKYLADVCKKKGLKIDQQTIHVAIENAWKDLELNKEGGR